MSDPGKGKRGRPPKGRQPFSEPMAPSEPSAGGGTPSGMGEQNSAEGQSGNARQWRRNLRRREPSTPENSWLATQPEFQRYWGNPAEPEPEPPMDTPQEDPPAGRAAVPPDIPAAPKQPRRKPADLSTLMARYTARAEEQEAFALPAPHNRPPSPEPVAPESFAHEPPGPGPASQNHPQGQEPAPRPAPARIRNTDPKFVASPLPAEPPEVEPGRPTRHDPSMPPQEKGRAPASGTIPGTIIVSDGQVKVIEPGSEVCEDGGEDGPEDKHEDPPANAPADASAQPPDPGADAAGAPYSDSEPETISQYLPSDDPNYATVSIRPVAEPVSQPEPASDDGQGGDRRGRDTGESFSGDEPPAPESQYDPEEPQEWWPPEPPAVSLPEPVRFDGPLPYQRQMHNPQGPNLADWDAANERLDFEPAWHAGQGGMGWGRKLVLFLLFLGIAGAGGYGVWSGEARRLVDFAATLMSAPKPAQEVAEAPAAPPAPVVAANDPEPAPATVTPPPAPDPAPAPPAPLPVISAIPGNRIAPDPNMKVRQAEGPAAQTTTLWWQPKTVTQFAALTPAELAAQPKPPTKRGESVMAPSGPLPGADAQTATANPPASPINSHASAAEIARIDDLIQSYAIEKADAAIAPLLASAPREPSVLMLSGRTALVKSANLEALATFDRVLAVEPANADAKIGRGRALVNLGRATEAQAIAAEVLGANPNHLGALWLSVEARAATGALEEALELCGRLEAAGAAPGSAEWCRGVANKRARRPLQAEPIFINALQSGSRDFVSLRQLYFRFKGYFNGDIDGYSSDDLIDAATRCAAVRDCNTAGL